MKTNKLLLIAALASVGALAACGNSGTATSATKTETPATQTPATETPATETPAATTQTVKFGVGYVSTFALSYGTWELDNTVVAAAFDKDGKVIDARIDVTQYKFTVTANGDAFDVATYTDDHYSGNKSKLELGTDYAMKDSSAIGKEVYEQIEAYADWTAGKTAAEVAAYDGDITGCSISTGAFSSGLTAAYAKAYDVENVPTTGLKVGVGMVNGGLWEGECSNYIAGALTDGSKVLTSYVDSLTFLPSATDATTVTLETLSYGSVNKYAANAVDGNAIMSKRDLGEKYGMKSSSAIGAEYDAQCASMDAYFTGKTLAEAAAVTAESEISGVSITPDGLVSASQEAVAYSVKDVITDKPVQA